MIVGRNNTAKTLCAELIDKVLKNRVREFQVEFVEARKAREARHAEYERIAEENAIKRKLRQQMIEQKRYQSSIAKKAISAAYEANIVPESVEGGVKGMNI